MKVCGRRIMARCLQRAQVSLCCHFLSFRKILCTHQTMTACGLCRASRRGAQTVLKSVRRIQPVNYFWNVGEKDGKAYKSLQRADRMANDRRHERDTNESLEWDAMSVACAPCFMWKENKSMGGIDCTLKWQFGGPRGINVYLATLWHFLSVYSQCRGKKIDKPEKKKKSFGKN